ncbi:MAG: transcriptional regulator [Clostridiales bacterium]|nr:transcriptional regulator [Clostridiales bacterium]
MGVFDFKKEYKDLYFPKKTPVIIQVPAMKFFMVEGKGNPNTSVEYKNAMEILYGLSYGIKMSKMNGTQPKGYFDYVVPPLEGLWWTDEVSFDGLHIMDKDKFRWVSMIRQPDFVTEEVFEQAKKALSKKKPELVLDHTLFKILEEGLCAQVMHIGSYDEEPATILKLNDFIEAAGYETDITSTRMHHEIYLGDPRKTKPENLKTVIRHPIKKKERG